MLYNHFAEKLLGLQDVQVENIEEIDETLHIYCRMERKKHKCPACGNVTDKIHDYREQFEKCAKTMINWLKGILNSFSSPVTNGFTEGCNNKIKVLKRNAYGYRNFKHFRNRILHIFSNQQKKQATT